MEPLTLSERISLLDPDHLELHTLQQVFEVGKWHMRVLMWFGVRQGKFEKIGKDVWRYLDKD